MVKVMQRERSLTKDIQIPGPTAQSGSDELKKLAGDFSTTRSDFSGFSAKASVQLALIKWVGVFFSGILVALVAGAVNIAWHASALNSEVRHQGRRLEKIEKNSEVVIQHLEGIERRLDAFAARLAPDYLQPKEKPRTGE